MFLLPAILSAFFNFGAHAASGSPSPSQLQRSANGGSELSEVELQRTNKQDVFTLEIQSYKIDIMK